jgi:hypothetical protein
MTQIAREFAATEPGVVAFRYHRVFQVQAGPSGQHQDVLFDAIAVDGRLVDIRVLRYTIGNSAASAQQIASVVDTYEHPKPGDVFEAPWDPRYLLQYRDARRGATIVFTAIDSSYGHGSGRFTCDAHRNVVSYAYAPTVMPEHATSGTVRGRRKEVLPGYWAMTSENQQYRGHYLVFGGSATLSLTESNFRRFASLPAAEAAIEKDRLSR